MFRLLPSKTARQQGTIKVSDQVDNGFHSFTPNRNTISITVIGRIENIATKAMASNIGFGFTNINPLCLGGKGLNGFIVDIICVNLTKFKQNSFKIVSNGVSNTTKTAMRNIIGDPIKNTKKGETIGFHSWPLV